MKRLALLVCCVAFSVAAGWAGVTGSTNPALFTQDSVDWCQYGCYGGQFASPQTFVSNLGATGSVGLVGTLQGFYNLQDGFSWGGGFPFGMGLIYNGAAFGNTPTQIAATFDNGVWGAGAWIQDNYIGVPFTATIELFDSSYLPLGSFSAGGVGNNLLFVGAFSSTPIWAVQFDLVDQGGNEDFAIGTLQTGTPEPNTLLLVVPSALGLAGVLRRRLKGVL